MIRATALSAALFSLTACAEKEPPLTHSDNLRLIGVHPLEVSEPSGVTLGPDGKSLWVISDEDGRVHSLDLEGLEKGSFKVDKSDLEGLTSVGDSALAVVSERGRELLVMTLGGDPIKSGHIDIPGSDNLGPEAVAYDPLKEQFHILKEKQPGILITLNNDLREISRRTLDFSRDYSGLEFEPVRRHFWILSDESRSIHVTNEDFEVQATFSTNIRQMEGLAVDYERKRLYVVSDHTGKLYVFEFGAY